MSGLGVPRPVYEPVSKKLINTMGSDETAAACYEYFHVGCFIAGYSMCIV
jgi:hypothetical protein